ncbi:MAG: DUF4249 domain-containing protein [Bacteroidales bacterium]
MHQIKYIIYFTIFGLIAASCIKPYNPDIKATDANKYVVIGEISNESSLQKVSVSFTSPIDDPQYIGVSFCSVTIFDNLGNFFNMDDMGNGNYQTEIDAAYIIPGASFKIEIYTPDGTHIVSDYDSISACPAIDSVYFVQKSIPTSEPSVYRHGIQFYVDLDGQTDESRYYRWEGVETWEYHAQYPLIWYYDGSVHMVWPPDYSKFICWRTDLVKSIFTLSTHGLAENRYKMLPLHFVDNKSSRLSCGYSLLIKQIAVSEDAYVFWDKMRINSTGQGGLYEKQPMPVKGNLHNLTHPDEEVLGYFGASRLTSKRIFISPIPDLILDYSTMCSSWWLGVGGFANIEPLEYPAALEGDEDGWRPYVMSRECVDCTELGGTTVKPDFWPF